MRAGDLTHRVAFDKRPAQADDGYGNTLGPFTEQFQRAAAFVYAGGGETVMAARLEGRGVMKVRVRSDSQTRLIAQDWRIRDVRSNADAAKQTVYAIKEVDAVTDRFWVYLMVERGVAA
jgi:hypothetical protein